MAALEENNRMQKTSTLSSGGFLSLCACEYVIPLPLCPGDIDCPPAQPTGRSLIRLQPPYQLAKHAQLKSQHQPTSSSYPRSNISLMVFFLRDCLPRFRSKVLVGTWARFKERKQSKSSLQLGPAPSKIRLPELRGDRGTHDCPRGITICCGQRGFPCRWAARRGCSWLHDKYVATAVSTYAKEPRATIRDWNSSRQTGDADRKAGGGTTSDGQTHTVKQLFPTGRRKG